MRPQRDFQPRRFLEWCAEISARLVLVRGLWEAFAALSLARWAEPLVLAQRVDSR